MNIINITNLFRAYFIETKKRLLIPCAILFGLIALISSVSITIPDDILTWPYYVLFFYVAFSAFGFMKNRAHFFTLPANTAERFTYVLLLIVVLGILFQLLAIAGVYFGAYLIHPLIYSGSDFSVMIVLKENLWSWRDYLDFASILSVFLFGTIYFKKNAFFKTFGIVMGFLLAIALYFIALLYITFGGMAFTDSLAINIANYPLLQTYDFVFTMLFLSLTYLRLRETEV